MAVIRISHGNKMKLYDTLSKKKKMLKPRSGTKIEIFVCGPTVYDYSHIGHARTYIAFDAFVKYLRLSGHKTRYVQNITDIDDKIIARARELKQGPEQLARVFETEYYHDMESLGINSVDKYARATDYIKQIISQVERLLKKDYAYETDDGIYYDISKFPDYGKLSNRTAERAEDAVSRIDQSVKKRNKGDFALWKYSKKDEPSWRPAPKGRGSPRLQPGRPGWHIEDTAITEQEFQEQYDIHGGARDLIFPHHESEIAQMEALSGKDPLANYWMHTGFLTVNSEKMSKSLGNFITIHEFLREHSKEVLRLLVLSSHYRSPIDFNEKIVGQAEANTRRLSELFLNLKKLNGADKKNKSTLKIALYKKAFERELDNDFNSPKALAVVFNLVREANTLLDKGKITQEDVKQILVFLKEVNSILGVIPTPKLDRLPKEVQKLIEQREKLRKEKKWDEADKIRVRVEKRGYILKDTPKGAEITKN